MSALGRAVLGTLSVLHAELTRRGVDITAFRTEHQAAFMTQQLFGTRFKFPAKGASCLPLLQRLQAAIGTEAITARSKRKVADNSQALEKRFQLERAGDTGLVNFCDGACEPNPGVGGCGASWLTGGGVEINAEHGGDRISTNNIIEITGALMALRWFADRAIVEPVRIRCDSQYVVKGCNGWRHS